MIYRNAFDSFLTCLKIELLVTVPLLCSKVEFKRGTRGVCGW